MGKTELEGIVLALEEEASPGNFSNLDNNAVANVTRESLDDYILENEPDDGRVKAMYERDLSGVYGEALRAKLEKESVSYKAPNKFLWVNLGQHAGAGIRLTAKSVLTKGGKRVFMYNVRYAKDIIENDFERLYINLHEAVHSSVLPNKHSESYVEGIIKEAMRDLREKIRSDVDKLGQEEASKKYGDINRIIATAQDLENYGILREAAQRGYGYTIIEQKSGRPIVIYKN